MALAPRWHQPRRPGGSPNTSSNRHGLTECNGPPHSAHRSRAESCAMVRPVMVLAPVLTLLAVPRMRLCVGWTVQRVKAARLGYAVAMMDHFRIVNARGSQPRHGNEN